MITRISFSFPLGRGSSKCLRPSIDADVRHLLLKERPCRIRDEKGAAGILGVEAGTSFSDSALPRGEGEEERPWVQDDTLLEIREERRLLWGVSNGEESGEDIE